MPSNADYKYAVAEKKFHEAKTDIEKLAALQEMRSAAPKHKGAEKLRAEITKKIAAAKKKMEKQKAVSKASGSSGRSMNVKKEGCGQIIFAGLPNSGKSSLINALSNASLLVGNYDFTTTKPEVATMNYKGTKVQLVEVPALIEGSSKGKANGMQILSVIRNADAVVLILEEEKAKEQLKIILNETNETNIKLNQKKPLIQITQSKFPGINIAGKKFLKIEEKVLVDFLKSMALQNCNLIINEETDLKKISEVLDNRIVYKKTLAVITKGTGKKIELKDLKGNEITSIHFSKENIQEIKEKIFFLLDKILIYTRKPGEKENLNEPLVLPKGITVKEVAGILHRDFAQKLKYVKVWGSGSFPGQKVSKEFQLKNGDLIEVYS
jgi:small GTP-binding protein